VSRLTLARTGDSTQDRNLDELQRWAANAIQGQLGPRQHYASGSQRVTPAVANPRGRLTVYLSDNTVIIADGGLNSDGTWTVNPSGACTAQFIWLE
jgi:hypothetical protein